MVNQDLLNYIAQLKSQGTPDAVIKQNLLQAGWSEYQIGESGVFTIPVPVPPPVASFNSPVREVRKPNPSSPYSVLMSLVLFVSLLILTQNALSDVLNFLTPYSKDINQSDILKDFNKNNPYPQYVTWPQPTQLYCAYNDQACVQRQQEQDLILHQKASDDYTKAVKDYQDQQQKLIDDYNVKHASEVGTRLIINTVLVLPFWLLTLGLYYYFRESREKYLVLLTPYYLTSVWLLIFLLFNVSRYVLDKDKTFGVYVVLLLLAGVLTGTVFGIQKYMHQSNDNS